MSYFLFFPTQSTAQKNEKILNERLHFLYSEDSKNWLVQQYFKLLFQFAQLTLIEAFNS